MNRAFTKSPRYYFPSPFLNFHCFAVERNTIEHTLKINYYSKEDYTIQRVLPLMVTKAQVVRGKIEEEEETAQSLC